MQRDVRVRPWNAPSTGCWRVIARGASTGNSPGEISAVANERAQSGDRLRVDLRHARLGDTQYFGDLAQRVTFVVVHAQDVLLTGGQVLDGVVHHRTALAALGDFVRAIGGLA